MATTDSRRKELVKGIVLGDSACGKTSLLQQYVNHRFTNQFKSTIGTDFLVRDMMINEHLITLQLWDTAGQERFRTLGTAFFRGAQCVMLVFDLTNHKSFENLDSWRQEFLLNANVEDPENFPFVVMGNKVDKLAERVVSAKRAEEYCRQNGLIYFETSARDGINVDQAFMAVVKRAHDRMLGDDPLPFYKDSGIILDVTTRAPDEKDKCPC